MMKDRADGASITVCVAVPWKFGSESTSLFPIDGERDREYTASRCSGLVRSSRSDLLNPMLPCSEVIRVVSCECMHVLAR